MAMQNTTTQFKLQKAALARGNLYRLLSQAYLYPSKEFFRLLQSGAFAEELRELASALMPLKKGSGLEQSADSMISEASKVAESSLSWLRSEYSDVFGHTISKECPPYETQYGMAHLFQQTQELGNVSGFYHAFGLEARSMERLDHISIEFEFMYFLCYKQAYAIENKHDKEKIGICVETQKKFLKQHLGWVFAFASLLKKKKNDGFYRKLAELTEGFISFELAYLGVKPRKADIPELTPVPSTCEESCFSCSNEAWLR